MYSCISTLNPFYHLPTTTPQPTALVESVYVFINAKLVLSGTQIVLVIANINGILHERQRYNVFNNVCILVYLRLYLERLQV